MVPASSSCLAPCKAHVTRASLITRRSSPEGRKLDPKQKQQKYCPLRVRLCQVILSIFMPEKDSLFLFFSFISEVKCVWVACYVHQFFQQESISAVEHLLDKADGTISHFFFTHSVLRNEALVPCGCAHVAHGTRDSFCDVFFCCLGKHSQTETGFKTNSLPMKGQNSITSYCMVLTFKSAKIWWLVK